MNPNAKTEIQVQQNWENFCQHHAIGDWHGTWTIYSSEGKVVDFFKCIRSLHVSSDGKEITHQNHYFYTDNKTETKTFGPYNKNTARALFLDNSFSWGTTTLETDSSFFFETGFRYKNRRASIVATYNENGRLNKILTIPENLAHFIELTPHSLTELESNNWRGVLRSITPELITSPAEATQWKRLEDLREHHLTLHFPEGVSISCPPQIEWGKEHFFAVDWLATSALWYRGIRYFDSRGFRAFTLETFTP
ncbi:hypothetical protein NIES593_11970 [Hydrococcus rivularis NIES-593]|uniref:Uncharacterized protein n=1 Tax=Hydrococcus rivularis NIES-593 TaxID=1921803 RepID=A0A1U7HGX8_9CYAN|nr:DUF3598 family protein [Hydrococcus rivularis]OKH22827.1 hypothetical protein NIES593_11970 [Hydrococcus rivularis NIES-593]